MSNEHDRNTVFRLPIASNHSASSSSSELPPSSLGSDSGSSAAPLADDGTPSSSIAPGGDSASGDRGYTGLAASAEPSSLQPATTHVVEGDMPPPLTAVRGLDLLNRPVANRQLRIRRQSNADSDAESDASLPSLQTVSDSSDEEWIDEDSEDEDEDAGDEEDDYEYDDEDGFDYGELFNSQPSNAIPPVPTRVMEDLLRAASEGLTDFDNDPDIPYLPMRSDMFRNIGPRGDHNNRTNAVLGIFQQAMANLGGPAIPETDSKRAEMIVKELELVPEDLVRRYEKLRAGIDDETCEGCAICRDSFIDSDVVDPSIAVHFAALPYSDALEDGKSLPPLGILAFPCPGMHLFHAECLSPWLGRKTTCPTCRYDIDPNSLTLSFLRDIRERARDPLANKKWNPPKGRGFKRWLEKQEKKLEPGYDLHGDPDSDSMPGLVGAEDTDDEFIPSPGPGTSSSPTATSARSHTATAGPRQRPADPHNPFLNMIDPVTRENMLAALLPIIDMVGGPEGSDHVDEEDFFSDEEDDELPDLIPVPRPTLGPVVPASEPADHDDHDELPDLVNEPSTSSRPSSHPSPLPRRTPSFPNSVFDTLEGSVMTILDVGSLLRSGAGLMERASGSFSYPATESTSLPFAPRRPRPPPQTNASRSSQVPLDEDDELPELVPVPRPSGVRRTPYHEDDDDELPDLVDDTYPPGPSIRPPSIDDID